MKEYTQLKKELAARRKNIRGFSAEFYKTFSHDLETARKGVEEAERLNIDFSVSDFWKGSETHKTYFFNHNSGAYCEMLSICE